MMIFFVVNLKYGLTMGCICAFTTDSSAICQSLISNLFLGFDFLLFTTDSSAICQSLISKFISGLLFSTHELPGKCLIENRPPLIIIEHRHSITDAFI